MDKIDSNVMDKINVQVDLNKLFEAYNKPDFMKQVFIEAITKNPKIFTEALRQHIIMDFMSSEIGTNIRNEVKKAVQELAALDTLKSNREFCRELDKVLIEEIKENRPTVSIRVKQVIDQPDFKHNVSDYLAQTVKERVTAFLGEVCDSCERDIY